MRSSETLPSSTCNPWKLLLASMPGIASGELMTAIAMTQPGTGSDLAGIRTTATRDGDHYVLNGAKTFITGGLNAPAGSALAVHAARLTSVAERQAVARALRRAVRDAKDTRPTQSGRVPMHRANIASAQALIDEVTLRLLRPTQGCGDLERDPVDARVGREAQFIDRLHNLASPVLLGHGSIQCVRPSSTTWPSRPRRR